MPGVDKVAVSLTHEQALVEYNPAIARPEQLLQTLRDIGYTISDPRKLRAFEEEERDLVREARRFVLAVVLSVASIPIIADPTVGWIGFLPALVCLSLGGFVFLVLRSSGFWAAIGSSVGLTIMALGLLYLNMYGYLTHAAPWLTGALAFILVFGVGRHILHMAVQALRRGILNQHVLLEIGAFAGIVGGIVGLILNKPGYPTAAFFAVAVMVGTYHIFSEWLSLIVKTRSSQAVKRLLDLQPETARVVRGTQELELPIEQVKAGDLIRIRPGERIPADGKVVEGHSGVDQSLVTGESFPVEKTTGDSVIGGSINTTGTLLVTVTAIGEGSFLNQVIRHVEDARALKPGILHLVDRVLRVYTPIVLVIAALAVVGWLVGSWLGTGHIDVERAVFAGLSVLVMGYPCAVGISAPLSIVRGAGQAAEHGILMRTGEAFQGFRTVTQIVLDKTGTLTEGHPLVREIERLDVSEEELLAIAAAAETSSEHPLARAVMKAAFDRGATPPDIELFEAFPGKGVVARIETAEVVVGSPRFLAERNVNLTRLGTVIGSLEADGRTVIAVARSGTALGAVALGDTLRSDAVAALAALRKAGLKTILVTGDNARAANRVARDVGVDEVHAEVLPQDKAKIIRELQVGSRVRYGRRWHQRRPRAHAGRYRNRHGRRHGYRDRGGGHHYPVEPFDRPSDCPRYQPTELREDGAKHHSCVSLQWHGHSAGCDRTDSSGMGDGCDGRERHRDLLQLALGKPAALFRRDPQRRSAHGCGADTGCLNNVTAGNEFVFGGAGTVLAAGISSRPIGLTLEYTPGVKTLALETT